MAFCARSPRNESFSIEIRENKFCRRGLNLATRKTVTGIQERISSGILSLFFMEGAVAVCGVEIVLFSTHTPSLITQVAGVLEVLDRDISLRRGDVGRFRR